jgi:phytoene dehydrogenase-like protein
MHDVVVVGAGVNGLVAGCVLARRKRSVVILDRRPTVGGAAAMAEIAPGFRVPRLSHALGPLRPDVARAAGVGRAGLEVITPDPTLTTLGRDGQTIVFHRDAVLTAASIARVSAPDAGRWREFVKVIGRIAGLVAAINRHPPPRGEVGVRDLWRLLAVGRGARTLGSADLARAMRWLPIAVADLAAEWFESDLLRAAISARAVFGHHLGPRSPGTGGLLLQRLADDDQPLGSGITVRGGPGALAHALAASARAAGATIRTARVAGITSRDGRATGVVLENGDEIPARVVVSAIDPRQTFTSLVDPMALPSAFLERMRHFRVRGVTAKINLALSSLPVFPALQGDAVPLAGRLLIAPGVDDIERAFDAAKYGRISPAPWIEISMPTIADPALAPGGKHIMSIYAQYAPFTLRDTTWTVERHALLRNVLATLDFHTPKIASLVVASEVITPEDMERDWGFSGGHIFHGETTLDQSWLARPQLGWARYRTPLPGLYLASAGSHPGGGLTGTNGLLAARAVIEDMRRS